MIKSFNYFFQALFIYLFFIIGKLIGLNLSRRFFAIVFSTLGPRFKSNSIINALKLYEPELFSHCKKALTKSSKDLDFQRLDKILLENAQTYQ